MNEELKISFGDGVGKPIAKSILKKLGAETPLKKEKEVCNCLNEHLSQLDALHAGCGIVLRHGESAKDWKMVFSLVLSSQPMKEEELDGIAGVVENKKELLQLVERFQKLKKEQEKVCLQIKNLAKGEFV